MIPNKPKVATVDGVDVFLNESGQFTATIGKETITRPSLSAIRKLIKGPANPFKVLRLAGRNGVEFVTIVRRAAANRSNPWVDDKGNEFGGWWGDEVYSADAPQSVIDEYKAAIKAKEQMDVRHSKESNQMSISIDNCKNKFRKLTEAEIIAALKGQPKTEETKKEKQ